MKLHNPDKLFPQYGNYAHGIAVPGGSRLLFISGLNGFLSDGRTMPESFTEQATIIWEHIASILMSAEMDYTNIVQLRMYLANPDYDEENMRLRKKYLGDHQTTLTVICCQLLEPKWKIEIEAIAASID